MTGTVEERAAHHGLAETLRPHPAVAAVDVLGLTATAATPETEIVIQGRTVPPVVLRAIADAGLALVHTGRQGGDTMVVLVR